MTNLVPKFFIISVERRNKTLRSIRLDWKDAEKTAELISGLMKEESGFLTFPVWLIEDRIQKTVFLSAEYLKDSVVTMETVYKEYTSEGGE